MTGYDLDDKISILGLVQQYIFFPSRSGSSGFTSAVSLSLHVLVLTNRHRDSYDFYVLLCVPIGMACSTDLLWNLEYEISLFKFITTISVSICSFLRDSLIQFRSYLLSVSKI